MPGAARLAGAVEHFVEKTDEANIKIEGASKGFFYSVYADSVTLSYKDTTLPSIRNIGVHLQRLRILRREAAVAFTAEAFSGGTIDGEIVLRKKTVDLALKVENASIAELLALAGLSGDGLMEINGNLSDFAGEFQIELTDLKLKPSGFAAILPVDRFRSLNGVLVTDGQSLHVKALEIVGEGIRARLKGVIDGDNLDLTLELFPDAKTVGENQLLLDGISKYRRSPGHYSIPIKGTLSHPVIR